MPPPAATARALPFACIGCGAPLGASNGSARCSCGSSYPVVAGDIPILVPPAQLPRFVPDPGITFERAMAIAEDLHRTPGSYHDLVDSYYESLRDVVVPELFDYYRDIVKQRSVSAVSDEVCGASLALDVLSRPFPDLRSAAEIGCGWGFSLASLGQWVATRPDAAAVQLRGFDLNPAILVIARRMFQDLGLGGLAVAVADAALPLPLPRHSVDFLFASSVVEHLPRQLDCMRNVDLALSPESAFYFTVPNRYTLHPEPHFNVRFVGLLPRRWQRRFVARRLRLAVDAVERIMSYSPQDLADLLCPTFARDMLAAVPAWVADRSRFWQLFTRPLQRLGVWYHHGVVRRTVAPAAPGVLQLGSIHRGAGRPRRVGARTARRPAGPVWPR